MIEIVKKCDHIYGFNKGDAPDMISATAPFLVETNSEYMLDIKFIYCPLCGEKLD